MEKVRKAVIPAAGYGTRFLPVTKGIPKEMLAIVDTPAIEYIVREAVDSGMEDILIIVSEGKDAMLNYFGANPKYDALTNRENLKGLDELLKRCKISFVTQEVLNGNGAAVMLAEEFADGEPIAVLFGDDVVYNPDYPVTRQLADAYERTGKCIVGCQDRPSEEAVKYGVVKKGKVDGRLVEMLDLIEKPSLEQLPSNLCSLGRFILPNSIFDALRRTPLYKNEIYLTVAIDILRKEQGVYAYDFIGKRYDLGDKYGFLQANLEYGIRSKYGDALKAYLKKFVAELD